MLAMAINGTVWQDPRLRNNHEDAALRNADLTRTILTFVEAQPAAVLRDHVALLVALSLDWLERDHRYVSAATVYRILRLHNYTRKRIERLFFERSEAAQLAFAVAFNEIPIRCVISVDETHTDGGDMYRRFGRAQRGVRLELTDRNPRVLPRTSPMMAVSMGHGVLWSQTVLASTAQTGDDWRLFLHCLKSHMNLCLPGMPWELLPDSCVILYDKAGIQNEGIDAFMQPNGMYHVRLSAYAPNLQPVEGVFAELKKHVRDLVYDNPRYLDKPFRLMEASVGRRTRQQITGQFQRVSNKLVLLLN